MWTKLCFIKKTANYFQLISVKEGIWITFIIKKASIGDQSTSTHLIIYML